MPEESSETLKEKVKYWTGQPLNALGLGVDARRRVVRHRFFLGPSSGYMENVQQMARGMIVGAIVVAIAYKAGPFVVRWIVSRPVV